MRHYESIQLAKALNKQVTVETTSATERNHDSDSDLAACMIGIRRNKAVIEVK